MSGVTAGEIATERDARARAVSPWIPVEAMRSLPRWSMSPTVFRYKNFRAFFFSREEARRHVHVSCPDGEAKFWLDPTVALADHAGLPARTLRKMQTLVEERRDEIAKAWNAHFDSGR
ncbi:MAG: DUF4160 domain-containing protein [Myxococcota bacterium]